MAKSALGDTVPWLKLGEVKKRKVYVTFTDYDFLRNCYIHNYLYIHSFIHSFIHSIIHLFYPVTL